MSRISSSGARIGALASKLPLNASVDTERLSAAQAEAGSGSCLNLPCIRRNRGISLRTIAEDTKIRTTYLEAIESEQFQHLPGQVYSVSYIRQYARAIDYDENAILALYYERYGERNLQSTPTEPAERTAAGALFGFVRMIAQRRSRL